MSKSKLKKRRKRKEIVNKQQERKKGGSTQGDYACSRLASSAGGV